MFLDCLQTLVAIAQGILVDMTVIRGLKVPLIERCLSRAWIADEEDQLNTDSLTRDDWRRSRRYLRYCLIDNVEK